MIIFKKPWVSVARSAMPRAPLAEHDQLLHVIESVEHQLATVASRLKPGRVGLVTHPVLAEACLCHHRRGNRKLMGKAYPRFQIDESAILTKSVEPGIYPNGNEPS
jgi:hypothetical protein